MCVVGHIYPTTILYIHIYLYSLSMANIYIYIYIRYGKYFEGLVIILIIWCPPFVDAPGHSQGQSHMDNPALLVKENILDLILIELNDLTSLRKNERMTAALTCGHQYSFDLV